MCARARARTLDAESEAWKREAPSVPAQAVLVPVAACLSTGPTGEDQSQPVSGLATSGCPCVYHLPWSNDHLETYTANQAGSPFPRCS